MRSKNVLLILLACMTSFYQPLSGQEKYTGQDIEDILNLPEEEINIGIATLVLAKEFYPDMDVGFFLNAFDYLAGRFNHFFGEYQIPDDRVRALNTYLYRKGAWNDGITFGYDDDDLQVTKRDNKFINGYIATKKGSYITMPMLYIVLAERLGFPIYPARSARHFFLRYLPGELMADFQANIEATNGGGFISDKQYQEDVQIPDKAIENGVYLRTLSKKEYLASLLSVNANEYIQRRDIPKAKHYLELAVKYDSTFSEAYNNYAWLHLAIARQLELKMHQDMQNELAIAEVLQMNQRNQSQNMMPNNNPQSYSYDRFLRDIVLEVPKPFQFEPPHGVAPNSNTRKDNIQKENQARREVKNNAIEIEQSLMAIEAKYKPQILQNLEVYKQYKAKSEELGIVKEFPIQFFQKQAESIKQYKEKGEY